MASSSDQADPLLARLSDHTEPRIEEVPFRLIANHERKTVRVLSNAAEKQALKSRNSFFYFEFNQPLFIADIVVSLDDFVDGSAFEYRWEGVDGVFHDGNAVSFESKLNIRVYGIAKSIAFKPPRVYFGRPHIEEVSIFGFELTKSGEFVKFAEKISDLKSSAINKIEKERLALENEKTKVAALQAQRGSLNQDISAFKSTVSREQGKIKQLSSQRDELIAKVGELERAVSDEENRLKETKDAINRLISFRSIISKNISVKKATLSDLESNIHLFPSELADFSVQGAHDSRTFLYLSFIPILLIALMFGLLTIGAADLTTKITESQDINLSVLAISRAPYMIIACTIITASYYIAKMLILEMVRISRQRLSLTKISILAKDVSSSVDGDLEMSDEEKYARRLTLKMDMMKDHLKEYLSTDFKPSLPSNIVPSINMLNPSNWSKKINENPVE
jgi:hypothetical protein